MKKLFLVFSLVLVAAFSANSNDSIYLAPPSNLLAINSDMTDYVLLIWDEPVDTITGTTPLGLIGYNIYRDGQVVGSVDFPETTYFDLNLPMLTFNYEVTAVYNLTLYGYPGETGESENAGPVSVSLCCVPALPFMESFITGSFETNQWAVDGEGNDNSWQITGLTGNDAPGACFTNSIPRFNYSRSLTSWWLNGIEVDSDALLSFDLKKEISNATETEFLYVDVFDGTEWKKLEAFSNDAGSDWENHVINISEFITGKQFKIRFRAEGLSSENISYWCIDNIVINCITGVQNTMVYQAVIYPNPASSYVSVKLNQPDQEYRVLNLQGTLITGGHIANYTTTINTREYAPGVYVLEFISRNGEVFSSKLIVGR